MYSRIEQHTISLDDIFVLAWSYFFPPKGCFGGKYQSVSQYLVLSPMFGKLGY